ncbi:Protohem IX farnesyltransferase [Candidatus Magnetoovum chiemensis]|nr:Protohem IX farnesyltransferase [Candidatus Magnetoovum chiemensis]
MSIIANYIKLTEPRINLLVIITGFIGMWFASKGMPDDKNVMFWALIGLGLATAGASVFNNYYDRDIDKVMKRTQKRPLPLGIINAKSALFFAFMLSAFAFAALSYFVNMPCAYLSLFAIVVYSYLYTVLLKRHTPYATEIGGIAGALPPVIGWASVRGEIGLEALILFIIMLLWQPPHFWALAAKYKEDYEQASIPVMPVVKSENLTLKRSLFYVIALTIFSMLPYFLNMAGIVYLVVTLTLGLTYILLYVKSITQSRDLNKVLFFFSIFYLTFSFITMAVDIIR